MKNSKQEKKLLKKINNIFNTECDTLGDIPNNFILPEFNIWRPNLTNENIAQLIFGGGGYDNFSEEEKKYIVYNSDLQHVSKDGRNFLFSLLFRVKELNLNEQDWDYLINNSAMTCIYKSSEQTDFF